MSYNLVSGVIAVAVAGLFTGGGGWFIKLLRKFKYEQWAFLGGLMSLFAVPWIVTLGWCPHALDGYREVWQHNPDAIIKSNIFSMCWGVANVLCGLCIVRIGFALTGAILAGIGVSLGVTIPMIAKGSGIFKDAPDLGSHAGMVVLGGVAVMLVGVTLVSFAGFGRDRSLKKLNLKPGGNLESPVAFATGLTMAAIAGVLSCGITFSFVYSQGPIIAAMKARGASDFAANYSVWAVGLTSGALINVLYPAYLMTKNKTWHVLTESWGEFFLIIIMGTQCLLTFPLMGVGMLRLGILGASVGFGIQQAMQMTGGQLVGFISGEWKGVVGKPRYQMCFAIVLLIVAAAILSYGNALAKP